MNIKPVLYACSVACMASALSLTSFVSPEGVAAQTTATQVQATETHRIPVGEFVKTPNMRNVSISPSGKKLAYLAAKGGQSVLVTLDLTTYQEKVILSSEESRERGDRQMTGFRWVGDDHILITVILRENLGFGEGNFRRLLAYDVNDGELIQQAWRSTGGDGGVVLYIDHEEGEYLLQRDNTTDSLGRRGYPEVVRVDIDTGKATRFQKTNPVIRGWAADSQGVIRAGFNRDRDSGKQRMLFKPDGERNLKTVFNEADATFTETLPAPSMFIPGTNYAYAVSNHEGFNKIYKIDMTTMTPVEVVFEQEGFDVQGLITMGNGSKLLGVRTFDGSRGIAWIDPEMKTIQANLDASFGEDNTRIVDWSDDLKTLVVRLGGTSTNPGYFIYNLNSGDFQLLNWSRVGLKDTPLNPVKAEWYTASDGTRMQAIVTYPRHRIGEKNLPVVVMPHGGPFGALSSTAGDEPWNQPLAEQGYVVIQPNYRGSGGYGKEFVAIGRRPGGYGMRMQDDLNDVLTYFGEKGTVDPSRACVMGWSYGGYAAARGAQRDPGVWKCAIAGAGVYDMPLMNKWDAENLGRFNRGFQATSDNPVGISPARNAEGPWSPILIVAAKRDARIPMEQAEALVSALERSGKVEGEDFKYIVQEQGTHNLPYDDVHIQWIAEANAWLEKYNPAYVASDESKAPPMLEVE
ncbi:MAG: prolyl oligopeptidase family serine peptidase [Pseudomonadota bacterium]